MGLVSVSYKFHFKNPSRRPSHDWSLPSTAHTQHVACVDTQLPGSHHFFQLWLSSLWGSSRSNSLYSHFPIPKPHALKSSLPSSCCYHRSSFLPVPSQSVCISPLFNLLYQMGHQEKVCFCSLFLRFWSIVSEGVVELVIPGACGIFTSW